MAPLPIALSPLVYLPHPAYAEDQPYYKTILSAHVIYRGAQTGAVVGALVAPGAYWLQGRRAARQAHTFAAPTAARAPFTTVLLRSAGVGSVVGTGAFTVALALMMMPKEQIEWQDRSWRLLENKGQNECDEFSLLGTGAAAGALAAKLVRPVGYKAVLGTLSAGNLLGVAAYMGWRYGVHGGKWD